MSARDARGTENHESSGPRASRALIVSAVTREKLDLLREVDAVYLDGIRKSGLYDEIWQAFAVLLPVRTVGVMGDGRTYDQACALRHHEQAAGDD